MKPSYCRDQRCGKQIQFGINDHTQKSMPIDMHAVDDGNIVWLSDGVHVHVLTKAEKETDTRPRFLSHFATCEFGPAFRRKTGGR